MSVGSQEPRAKSQEPPFRSAHAPITIVLLIGLALTLYIGLTGSFTLFNAKGLLSGPFSFLLLLGATQLAALLLVVLDWKVWKPRGRARARQIEQWLAADVLNNKQPVAPEWEALHGSFRGRTVAVQRKAERRAMGMETWRWSAKTAFKGTFKLVRASVPAQKSALDGQRRPSHQSTESHPEQPDLCTGDAEFEERYQWQSDRPAEAAALLRQPELRAAVKRLASLFSRHGSVHDATCGIQIERGELVLWQAPAPVFARSTFSPDELLLLLHDLTLTAATLEGSALPPAEAFTPPAPPPASSAWLALGCGGIVALALWLGATYLVARYIGLPAAMIAFFMPAVALAFGFIALSTGGSGRDPEVESTIETEAQREIGSHPDLRSLAQGIKQ